MSNHHYSRLENRALTGAEILRVRDAKKEMNDLKGLVDNSLLIHDYDTVRKVLGTLIDAVKDVETRVEKPENYLMYLILKENTPKSDCLHLDWHQNYIRNLIAEAHKKYIPVQVKTS
ncbi:MAG: hypothetical protein WCK29_04235 [archaeon]